MRESFKSAVIRGRYRYSLSRRWRSGSEVTWIMLNPSTANASEDDSTIRRCIGYADSWGHNAIVVVNLFALRATNPLELYSHPDPVGPLNDGYIVDACENVESIVLAWGTRGNLYDRDQVVERLLRKEGVKLSCLGTTDKGFPVHPLYQRGDLDLVEYLGRS